MSQNDSNKNIETNSIDCINQTRMVLAQTTVSYTDQSFKASHVSQNDSNNNLVSNDCINQFGMVLAHTTVSYKDQSFKASHVSQND